MVVGSLILILTIESADYYRARTCGHNDMYAATALIQKDIMVVQTAQASMSMQQQAMAQMAQTAAAQRLMEQGGDPGAGMGGVDLQALAARAQAVTGATISSSKIMSTGPMFVGAEGVLLRRNKYKYGSSRPIMEGFELVTALKHFPTSRLVIHCANGGHKIS